MTIQEAWQQLATNLKKLYDDREAANIANLVIEHLTGYNRVDRIVHKNDALVEEQKALFFDYSQQLLQNKPLQYVLHEAWFAGLKFYVDEHVLIPRPETEELVELIGKEQINKTVRVLDIGTGSGCIPIALKKLHAGWEVHGLDISEGALGFAKRNAEALGADITFYHSDILDNDAWQQLPDFDIIVSNPPYIRESEAAAMNDNVLRFEPHTALFVGDDDALLFYRHIAEFALLHLNDNGLLFFEINESLGNAVCELLAHKGFTDVELIKDLQGRDRMVKANRRFL